MCSSDCSADEGHLRASWIFKQLLGAEVSIRRSLRLCFLPLSLFLSLTPCLSLTFSLSIRQWCRIPQQNLCICCYKEQNYDVKLGLLNCAVIIHGNLVLSLLKSKRPALIKAQKSKWLVCAATELSNFMFMQTFSFLLKYNSCCKIRFYPEHEAAYKGELFVFVKNNLM